MKTEGEAISETLHVRSKCDCVGERIAYAVRMV
jgi:hypothetical protein